MKQTLFFPLALLAAMTMAPSAVAQGNTFAASQMHHKYTAWNAVRNHLISEANESLLQTPLQAAYYPGYDCLPKNTWINYVGRDSRYRNSYTRSDWTIATNGIQLGTDVYRTRQSQVGVLYGYEDSTGTNLGDRIKGWNNYFGVYGVQMVRSNTDIRTVFNYGWQHYHSQRRGVDDDSYGTAFRGNTAELNIDFGSRIRLIGWHARPSLGLDWYWNQLHGGRETASETGAHALQYGRMDFSQLFLRLGSDFQYEWANWTLESGVFYSHDLLGQNLRSRVSNGSGARSTLAGSKMGRQVISFNLGGSRMVMQDVTIFGGYRGEVTPDRDGRGYTHIGHFGGAVRW